MAANSPREEFYKEIDKARHRKGFGSLLFALVLGLIVLGVLAYLFFFN